MPKSLSLGNGNILVMLDKRAQLKDFYFPYVGLENQVGSHFIHRCGVFADGELFWFDNPEWEIQIDYSKDTMSSCIHAINQRIQIALEITDVVYNEQNIYIRKIVIHNLRQNNRQIKVFFNQQFEFYESHRGDTAFYHPQHKCIIHYKGRRVFVVNSWLNHLPFDDYSVGLFGIEGKEGTHRDAEDGYLSKNNIEHGQADSVIGITVDLKAQNSQEMYYWLGAAKTLQEALDINAYVLEKTPAHLIKTTEDFWKAWVNKQNFCFFGLTDKTIDLFKKSLFVVRTHIDNNGSILAAGDSDLLQHGRDTYSYLWPRDGAMTSIALDKAGIYHASKKFFEFCRDVLTEDGYLMHKYRPDKSLGSSWHPWIRNGKPELPIQEDETALVVYSLWKHYEMTKDIEFIESLYNPFIKKAANFMVSYIDERTNLPKPTYDLWEEKFGASTFTCASVYAALIAASKFAYILGKVESGKTYIQTAEAIKDGILKYLYDEKTGNFHKMLNIQNNEFIYDDVIDMSSVYGIFKYKVLDLEDERLTKAIQNVENQLRCKTHINGIPRYQNDKYFSLGHNAVENPWFITTLWLAQYYIAKTRVPEDLDIVKKWFNWVESYASPSGMLSEQLNPYTGEQMSATPLTWSHAEFIVTIIEYLEKLEELGISKVCQRIL